MKHKTISVIGGTGSLGKALSWRWAQAGYNIVIGSRTSAKAQQTADELNERLGFVGVRGMANADAAEVGEIIVLTVPFSAHASTLGEIKERLKGQVLVDATVPLKPPKVDVVSLPPAGSAAVITRELLEGKAEVVSAFHNVAANRLDNNADIDCDVLISGDNKEAKQLVIELTEDLGCRGIDAGVLANSAAAEAMTSLLIHINKTYKIGHAGVKISGI